MTTNPFSSGGGGINFENKVGMYYLGQFFLQGIPYLMEYNHCCGLVKMRSGNKSFRKQFGDRRDRCLRCEDSRRENPHQGAYHAHR